MGNVFRVCQDSIELIAEPNDIESRSLAVASVLEKLRSTGRVSMLKGWRNEPWPVKGGFDAPVEFVVERAAGPLFGVTGYGCHVNGLVPSKDSLWIARRSRSKQTYPGMLDHLVAGGLPHGEEPGENVIRECAEEASIPLAIAALARPAGIIGYCHLDETRWGIKPDIIYCYDLELPADFTPVAADGEVESFSLEKIRDVMDSLAADNNDWKPNVALVIIDMFIRRGFIKPEEQGYVDLVRALRP